MRRKKCAKKADATAKGALRGNNFAQARTRSGPDFYFGGAKDVVVTAFKGAIIAFFKVLAVLSLGLRHALITLATPTFLV
jgi:hypothetical protein